jgi:hypothetical protein
MKPTIATTHPVPPLTSWPELLPPRRLAAILIAVFRRGPAETWRADERGGRMTGTASPIGLPDDLVPVVEDYRACEFVTVNRGGTAIAWPTIPLYDRDTGTFTVTTSIGFPTKALNIRRNPHVAMLFSDPTGSGRRAPAQVLVQGTANCPDEIVTEPDRLEEYWRLLYARQPAGRMYGANPASRRLFDWYYFRLVITVTPTAVSVREPSPRTEPMTASRAARSGSDPYSQVLRHMRAYDSAVLSWVADDGFPRAARTSLTPVPDGQAFAVELPGDEPVREGPAGLLCHKHDEKLWKLSSFVATGELTSEAGQWRMTPTGFIPGAASTPAAVIRTVRGCRASAARYLERRGLSRPQVPWQAYHRIADSVREKTR